MWWSHADTATYLRWLEAAAFRIETVRFVPEKQGGHALIVARAAA